jgi:rod shape determining protein RodA
VVPEARRPVARADFLAAALLLVPVALVARQPDLGTSLLILFGGLYVIFFAGLSWRWCCRCWCWVRWASWRWWWPAHAICEEGVRWPVLRDYQQHRVCTLLDPTRDPLGKGFHIIQGMIAIGSGGLSGKGFMQGTQTHLEFIPERTTDFIFAAFCEEFGLAGVLVLLAGFLFLIFRGLMIAAEAPTVFARLLAGAVTMSLFTYAFVNMGMVSGILPVVGVPLPFISYGGTAMVSLGLGLGILMSVARSRRLMQSLSRTQDPRGLGSRCLRRAGTLRASLATAGGCRVVATPAALAADSDLVFVVVIDAAQTRDVLFGVEGAAAR